MKKIFFATILFLNLWACSEPEPDLQLSNPEAFAFDLDDSWEVTASVKAKGFAQEEKDSEFNAKLNFSVDLVIPSSDSLLAIYSDNIDKKNNEEFIDIILEAQVEIDSSFGVGDYVLVFNVKDELSNQIKSIEVKFDLTK